jgi:hypothetical protein
MQIEQTLAAWFAAIVPMLECGFASGDSERSLEPAAAAADVAFLNKDWIARTTDNVCGLRDPNQISYPALVDFKASVDATPEMKKARQDKIDLTTPEGIKLVNEAVNRVTAACETVRVANSYCSVWKTIRHKDGRAVADITELVKAQY